MILNSKDLSRHIGSIIHKDTQHQHDHFDLTVSSIYQFTTAGSLDFGGSEFQPAEKKELIPQKSEGDKYGWWHLQGGFYQAKLNETVKTLKDTIALLFPHRHALLAGLLMESSVISSDEADDDITINFQVPNSGCNIKENARIAEIYLYSNIT